MAALWVGAIAYVVLLSALIARGNGSQIRLRDPLAEQIVLLLLWAIATPAIVWSANRLPIERGRVSRIGIHLAVAIAFIVSLNVLAPAITWALLGRVTPFGAVLRNGLVQVVAVGHLALVVYAFILGAGHYLHTLDVRREEQMRAERLRADLVTAQLRALTLQLQPHFLFNALNAVGALILTERHREAFDVVGRLGDLLRVLLAIERRPEVSLREEIELAESYVGIEQARLGDRLRVVWDVDSGASDAQVPPMLLQPLVENAIRHGVARRPDGGSLTIAARRRDAVLVLEVSDDGPGIEPRLTTSSTADASSAGGLGLENTRQRLTQLYGESTRLDLTRAGAWTRVRVEVPYHLADGQRAESRLAESTATSAGAAA